jgi:hypothetical protein
MKQVLIGLLALTSISAFANDSEIFKCLAGNYILTAPDDGLVVVLDINKRGKVALTERFIGSGLKSVCDKEYASIDENYILKIQATCKVRDGYDNILNRDKRNLTFSVDMSNIVQKTPASADGMFLGNYTTENGPDIGQVLIKKVE